MTDSADDFERTGNELGAKWTTRYTGFGMKSEDAKLSDVQCFSAKLSSDPQSTKGEVLLYGRMPGIRPSNWNVGARITSKTLCTRCGKPFLEGHALTADLAPNMSGTARHTDCDDPMLENFEKDI